MAKNRVPKARDTGWSIKCPMLVPTVACFDALIGIFSYISRNRFHKRSAKASL